MLTFGWILLAALGGLAALLIALMALPATLEFELRTSPRWRLRITARLLGGATGAIRLHDSARRQTARPRTRPTRAAGRGRTTPARALRIAAGAPRLVIGLLRPIRLRRLAIDADVGLGDPADTGQFFGLVNTIAHVLPAAPSASISLRPDFDRLRASGRLEAEISFVPLAFVPPGVRFAWRVFGPG